MLATSRTPHAAVDSVRPLKNSGVTAAEYGKLASLGLMAAGFLLLAGSLVDVGVLWALQRQASPQWEFVAVGSTLDAIPRLVIALALLHAALAIRQSRALWAYRAIAAGMILLGLTAAALGFLMVTDYFVLAEIARQQPEALALFRSTAAKAVGLAALTALVLLSVGILGLRRPRAG